MQFNSVARIHRFFRYHLLAHIADKTTKWSQELPSTNVTKNNNKYLACSTKSVDEYVSVVGLID